MSKLVSFFFKHQILQILFVVGLYLLIEKHIPEYGHQFLYSISITIKDLLKIFIPFAITIFIATTISKYEKNAPLFVILIVIFEALSNGLSVYYAYGSALIANSFFGDIGHTKINDSLVVLWKIPEFMPKWWSVDKGAILGLFLGVMQGYFRNEKCGNILASLRSWVEFVLSKIFARVIILFVLGFIANIHQSNMLHSIEDQYSLLFVFLIIIVLFYLVILFLFSANFCLVKFVQHGKNLLPAGLIALTSGCSISTMPWTIAGTAKNLKNPEFAKAVIPATTNIQQVGDCIINCFLCVLIYNHFYGHVPDIKTWFIFSIVFVAARYATAAIMGGAIFIMLPIYQQYLGFNNEMIALILALNVILDPLVTSSNILANGALCSVFERFFYYFKRNEDKTQN
jgi:hypothetical protein